ncbi:hypothetical protein MMC18_009253 [Xylographa bjoerkii]|nr:hypothetical protein [Xylographa bjoerkii]
MDVVVRYKDSQQPLYYARIIFMSIPTQELEGLSIGGPMATARQRGQRNRRARQAREKAEQEARALEEAQRGTPTAGPSGARVLRPSTTVSGSSGIQYDIGGLRPQSRFQAMEALQSSAFTIKRTQEIRSNSGVYFAFQLKKPEKPESIRIRSQAAGGVTCTCAHFTQNIVCAHVYWLYDEFNGMFLNLPVATIQIARESDILLQLADFHTNIQNHLRQSENNLATLTRDLNMISRDDVNVDGDEGDEGDSEGTSQLDDEDSDNSSQASDSDSTEWVIKDMLSVFDEERLPDEYGRQVFVQQMLRNITTPRDIIDRKNLVATIHGLAIYDEKLRRRLRRVLTKEYCALDFLRKIENRIDSGLEGLKAHTNRDTVGETAALLRRCVDQVPQYIEYRAPFSVGVKRKAAWVIVDLLCRVCDCGWNPTVRDQAGERKRNLFKQLIGDQVKAEAESEPAFFVLDCLEGFAFSEWQDRLEQLQSALGTLKKVKAPYAYIKKLEDMMQPYLPDTTAVTGPEESTTRVARKRPRLTR